MQDVNANTRETLEYIGRSCSPFQEYAQCPLRFKFILRNDIEFNHTTYADIFYIDAEPIIYIVDEATRFQAATILKIVSAETL